MKKFLILCILSTVFGYQSSSQSLSDYYPSTLGELVEHTYYTLDYNEEHEQANWVIYFAGNFGSAKRSDNFRSDDEVDTESATLDDYAGSGYDRGHLAPAADMNLNSTAMSESFYLSNMSPQVPGFNRGIWKKLEALTRDWSALYDSPWDVIVTGPVLDKSCGKIGTNVSVPCRYYKIYANLETLKAIAFLLPNESSKKELSEFVVAIDDLEAITGIDFFYLLDDAKEAQFESTVTTTGWDWDPKVTITPTPSEPTPNTTSAQCKGTTQSGKRCSRKAGASGYCWQHEEH